MHPQPLTFEQEQLFGAWRALALGQMPYMAHYLYNLRVLSAPGLGTAAVDAGFRLYLDFEALEAHGPQWCSETLLHEVGHLFGQHHVFARDLRVPDQLAKVWNVAADFSLNDDLVAAGCSTLSDMVPAVAGLPDGRTANEYFLALLKAQRAAGVDPTSAAAAPATDDDDGQAYAGCGSGSGGPAAPCELLTGGDAGGWAPAVTSAERDRIQLLTAKAIVEHEASGRGRVPVGLRRTAQMALAPTKTPWQQLLAAPIRAAVRFRAGQTRPNYTARDRRRSNVRLFPGGPRVIFPGRRSPRVRIACVRDTSGSMSRRELEVVTREVVTIGRRLRVRGEDLVVLDVDAAAHTRTRFRNGRELLAVAGGGGTDMRVGILKALASPGGVDVIVVLTDGFTPWPSAPVGVPVIAAIVGPDAARASAGVPSWIKVVAIEDVKEGEDRG